LPNFSKNSPKSCKVKKGQNTYKKAQFESPKHQQQTTFDTLKYLQLPCLENAYLDETLINLLKQKVSKNVAIILGYFVLPKHHDEPPKVAQLAKNHPIWSPCFSLKAETASAGSTISNGREHKSCLGRVFNFKLGCFA
jgi:hypothetical protein